MRTKGYKCFNIECGGCIAKTLCGEPGDAALSCQNRVVAAQKERHTKWISIRGKKHPTIEDGEKHLNAALNRLAVLEDMLECGDLAPVKHGRWVEKCGRAACSICGDECWADSVLEYNYCPNCGSKMDEEG